MDDWLLHTGNRVNLTLFTACRTQTSVAKAVWIAFYMDLCRSFDYTQFFHRFTAEYPAMAVAHPDTNSVSIRSPKFQMVNKRSCSPIDLRFAGLYFDVETNLHYTFFRDYEPATGRYLSSDPIGLVGGLNTYGYALQNPLSFSDPYGLYAIPLVIPLGEALVNIATIITGIAIIYNNQIDDSATDSVPYSHTDKGCKCKPATPQNIRTVLSSSTYQTLQMSVSAPVIQVFANRIENGQNPPPITIDGNIIVDGNHRYIAALLCGRSVAANQGTAPLTRKQLAIPISQIRIDLVDYGNR